MHERVAPSRGVVLAATALLCLIWGSTWATIQVGLQGIPPFTGVSMRFAIASLVLFGAAIAMRVKLGGSRRERALWLANGTLSFTISYGVVYWCEQWIPSGLAAVLFATYPLWVALLAHVALPGESLSRREALGVVAGFAGVAVIFSEDFNALGGSQVAFASAVMLLSPLSSAFGSVAIKRWGAGIHPLSLTVVPMAVTSGVMAALALAVERGSHTTFTVSSVGALLYLAIPGSAVTFSLFYYLLSHLPAKRLALIAYIVPVVAVIIGVIRGEPMAARMLAGGALVIGGVAMAVHRR